VSFCRLSAAAGARYAIGMGLIGEMDLSMIYDLNSRYRRAGNVVSKVRMKVRSYRNVAEPSKRGAIFRYITYAKFFPEVMTEFVSLDAWSNTWRALNDPAWCTPVSLVEKCICEPRRRS
jgi:hypothetical protein